MDPVAFVNENTDYTLCCFDLTHMVKKKRLSNHLFKCSLNHLSDTPPSVTECQICLVEFKTVEFQIHLLEHLQCEKLPYSLIDDTCGWWPLTHYVCMYNKNHVVKKSKLDSHLEKCQSKHSSDSLIRCCLCHNHFVNEDVFGHLLLHKCTTKIM